MRNKKAGGRRQEAGGRRQEAVEAFIFHVGLLF